MKEPINLMKTILSLILLGILVPAFAQLEMPRIFADQMVLQRGAPVKFWGTSDPGEAISVRIGGITAQGSADASGSWEVIFPEHAAGGPYTVSVVGGSELAFSDVWFGDVWIAGGQSNMEWKLSWGVDNWEEEVRDSNYPQIRFFEVPNVVSVSPQSDIPSGEWKTASPQTAGEFSAVAWFFAKRNHLEKNVPVGIISSNWGGTPAEAWTSIETLEETSGYEKIADTIVNPSLPWPEFEKQNEAKEARKWELMRDQAGAIASGAQMVGYEDSDWTVYDLPCNCKMTDLAWLRREVTLSPDSISDMKLYISNVVQEAFVFFNGELLWSKKWNDDIKTLDIPKGLIREGKNVIAYRVANSWDNNVYFGRPGEMWLQVNGKQMSLEGNWKYSSEVEPRIPQSVKMFQMPSFLYNSKIAPIGGYTARGVIWYQGESNAGQPQYYRGLFSNMIADWRQLWGDDLAFLYVQLANFMERKDQPQQSNWAELREAQAQTLSVPKTGMALTIDIGDAEDIHPRNKQDVGKRLWLAAKKVSYGEEVVYSGPTLLSQQIKGNEIILDFEHKGGGLMIQGDSPKGFAIAGDDKQFVWANARLELGTMVVWSDAVNEPRYVRYAWADNPECNVYNMEGLPMVPFRTDN